MLTIESFRIVYNLCYNGVKDNKFGGNFGTNGVFSHDIKILKQNLIILIIDVEQLIL